ncbi:hypothetical protein [Mycolicibacterium sphagni]|uniref:hypothetical protein n=1 Tax=Mycolicibacterium sphagni TaxID=1786 RepID=UPI0013FD107A|nr:hypothetical protein [Mycolicibacterium sphagni]
MGEVPLTRTSHRMRNAVDDESVMLLHNNSRILGTRDANHALSGNHLGESRNRLRGWASDDHTCDITKVVVIRI